MYWFTIAEQLKTGSLEIRKYQESALTPQNASPAPGPPANQKPRKYHQKAPEKQKFELKKASQKNIMPLNFKTP